MQRQTCKFKSGRVGYRPVIDEPELTHALFAENLGFCLNCGAETDGVEPDARRYHCEECSMPYVYGLEELLLMGLIRIGEAASRAEK